MKRIIFTETDSGDVTFKIEGIKGAACEPIAKALLEGDQVLQHGATAELTERPVQQAVKQTVKQGR